MTHLVLVRKRGQVWVLRCFDCAWGAEAGSREGAWAAEEAHIRAPLARRS